ncbi:hypothetical protein TNCV_3331631 [Trichonephila clavipes]|nr:hypothetical protein TNCV_3331631 [Trichonephila clavipes]
MCRNGWERLSDKSSKGRSPKGAEKGKKHLWIYKGSERVRKGREKRETWRFGGCGVEAPGSDERLCFGGCWCEPLEAIRVFFRESGCEAPPAKKLIFLREP